MKRSPLRRKTPMRRSAMPPRHAWMQARRKRITAAERRAYREATERATAFEGYVTCENCGRSLLTGQEHRHHVLGRHRGTTRADALQVLCPACHDAIHSHRRSA